MQKIRRFLVISLALLLVCTMMTAALGETCQVILKTMFTDNSTSLYVGRNYITIDGLGDKVTMVWYDTETSMLFLSGSVESYVFTDVSEVDALYVIYSLCGVWDTLEGMLDSGYTFALAMVNGDDSIYVTSALEAAMFKNAVEKLISE